MKWVSSKVLMVAALGLFSNKANSPNESPALETLTLVNLASLV